MKKNIFLASYPKSGNTWLRCIVTNLLNPNKEFDLKDIKTIHLLSDKKNFKDFEKKIFSNNGNLDFNWLTKNLIECQKIKNLQSKKNKIYKTHSIKSKFFTNENVNLGFIYIIRDPRDIVVSLSYHSGGSYEKTIHELLYNDKLISSANGANELISTWELNLISWLEYKNVSRLIIKYEDMLNNTHKIILEIGQFLEKITGNKVIKTNERVDQIVKNTNFSNLKYFENLSGFEESTKYSKFFRKGHSGQWHKNLSNEQIKHIEKKLKYLMKNFNYL